MRFFKAVRLDDNVPDVPLAIAWILNMVWPNSLESIHDRHFRHNGSFSDFCEPYLPDAAHRQRFLEYLRVLVDQWISSGNIRTLDGSYIHDSWARRPNAVVLETFERSCRLHGLPRITFSQANRVEFRLPLLDPEINQMPGAASEIFAIHWFVHLLNSDRRECLNRCDSCGRYFVRTRMPGRGAITKRGVFCPIHRHLRKSRSITAMRNVENGNLIQKAALALNRWGKLSSGTRRKYANNDRNYIAAQIEIYGRTRKWVTHNFDAIGREAEQLEGNNGTR